MGYSEMTVEKVTIVFLNGFPLTPLTDYVASGNTIILSYGVDVGDKLRYHK